MTCRPQEKGEFGWLPCEIKRIEKQVKRKPRMRSGWTMLTGVTELKMVTEHDLKGDGCTGGGTSEFQSVVLHIWFPAIEPRRDDIDARSRSTSAENSDINRGFVDFEIDRFSDWESLGGGELQEVCNIR